MAPFVMNLAAQPAAKCNACALFTREPVGGLCSVCVSDLPPNMRPKLETELTVPQKLCSVCGVVKPRDAFNRSQKALTGLASECKVCRNAINATAEAKRLRREREGRTEGGRQEPPKLPGSRMGPKHKQETVKLEPRDVGRTW